MNQPEQPFDYIALAQRTKSDKYFGELVPLADFVVVLTNCVRSAQQLDVIKKAMFYGKAYPVLGDPALFRDDEDSKSCERLGVDWYAHDSASKVTHLLDRQRALDILHGIVGKVTEAGEMLEALLKVLNGAPVDIVNVKEETFDSQWYDAIICAAIGVTFEDGQRQNIAKLRKRFPDKFDTGQAINRDHAAEREVLEVRRIPINGPTALVQQLQQTGEYKAQRMEETMFEGKTVVAKPGEDLTKLTQEQLRERADKPQL